MTRTQQAALFLRDQHRLLDKSLSPVAALDSYRALRSEAVKALVADVGPLGFEDGNFHLPERAKKPCARWANGCKCGCRPKSEKKQRPLQPWQVKKAA